MAMNRSGGISVVTIVVMAVLVGALVLVWFLLAVLGLGQPKS